MPATDPMHTDGPDPLDHADLRAALHAVQRSLDLVAVAATALAGDPTRDLDDLRAATDARDAQLRTLGLTFWRWSDERRRARFAAPTEVAPCPVALVDAELATLPSSHANRSPAVDGARAAPTPDAPRATPEPAPTADAPRATAESLLKLVHHLGGAPSPRPRPQATRTNLRPFVDPWGSPGPLTPAAAAALAGRQREALRHLDDWLTLPAPLPQRLLQFAVAMARHVQEHTPASGHDAVFHHLTAWSKAHEPGFVHGLAREHRPEGTSWAADAERAWEALGLRRPQREPAPAAGALAALETDLAGGLSGDALRKRVEPLVGRAGVSQDALADLLVDHLAELHGSRALRTIKRRAADRARPPKTEPEALPVDWAWAGHTRGRAAVLVGGDDRGPARERLRKLFGFRRLDWETGWEDRRVGALAERIRSGSFDVVVFVARYLKHKTSECLVPACKEAGVPFVFLHEGYGASALRAEIERTLPQKPATEG
jgi:hypothetical protein